MQSSMKHKIPLILMVIGMTALVVAISAVGILFSRGRYTTVGKEVSDAASAAEVSDTNTQASQSLAAQTKQDSVSVSKGGKTDSFDAVFYAKRLYELKYLFAIDGFNQVSELPVSAAVQFAFCHLYYDSLVDMPNEKDMFFRQVLPESVSSKLQQLFGENKIDVTQSDLYNPNKKVVEMWQPNYRKSVYADVVCSNLGNGAYEIAATFYIAKDKEKVDSIVSGTFKKDGEGYILKSMNTKQ